MAAQVFLFQQMDEPNRPNSWFRPCCHSTPYIFHAKYSPISYLWIKCGLGALHAIGVFNRSAIDTRLNRKYIFQNNIRLSLINICIRVVHFCTVWVLISSLPDQNYFSVKRGKKCEVDERKISVKSFQVSWLSGWFYG